VFITGLQAGGSARQASGDITPSLGGVVECATLLGDAAAVETLPAP